jgi:hypothetical protein
MLVTKYVISKSRLGEPLRSDSLKALRDTRE